MTPYPTIDKPSIIFPFSAIFPFSFSVFSLSAFSSPPFPTIDQPRTIFPFSFSVFSISAFSSNLLHPHLPAEDPQVVPVGEVVQLRQQVRARVVDRHDDPFQARRLHQFRHVGESAEHPE